MRRSASGDVERLRAVRVWLVGLMQAAAAMGPLLETDRPAHCAGHSPPVGRLGADLRRHADPARRRGTAMLGQSATPEALANIRAELGLNEPAYVRYFDWLGGVLQGDFGKRCRAARTSRPRSAGGCGTRCSSPSGRRSSRCRSPSSSGCSRCATATTLFDKLISGLRARLDLAAGVFHRLPADLLLRREAALVSRASRPSMTACLSCERMQAIALPALRSCSSSSPT